MRTTKKTQTTEKALDAFLARIAEIRDALAAIEEAADDHFDVAPDEVDWSHVGDLTRTALALNEILAIIRGENR